MRDTRRRAAALVAVSCLMASWGHGADEANGQAVGLVAEYRPATARYTLLRAPSDQAVAVRIGTVVVEGDRLALPGGATIVVQFADDTVRRFDGPGTYVIPPAGALLEKLRAILGSLPALFDAEYRLAGMAASRGGEECAGAGAPVPAIDVPILSGGAMLVAGERDIPLAWRGGCAPFVVTVIDQDGATIYRETVEGRQLRLDDVSLSVGRYAVAVTDSTGVRFESRIDAVRDGPTLPSEIRGGSTVIAIVAQAVWLAREAGGRWRLESFERLRPLVRAGNPLAGAIADGLLWGRSSRQ